METSSDIYVELERMFDLILSLMCTEGNECAVNIHSELIFYFLFICIMKMENVFMIPLIYSFIVFILQGFFYDFFSYSFIST